MRSYCMEYPRICEEHEDMWNMNTRKEGMRGERDKNQMRLNLRYSGYS
jgi:hypothetical protein